MYFGEFSFVMFIYFSVGFGVDLMQIEFSLMMNCFFGG
jgi:hypothetical protein